MSLKFATLAACAVGALVMGSGIAQATPSLDYSVQAWTASTNGANPNSANQQALPTNPIIGSWTRFFNGSFTGTPNWRNGAHSPNTLGDFTHNLTGFSNIQYFNGNSANTVLSRSNVASVALFELSFTLTNAVTATVTHDDGFSL